MKITKSTLKQLVQEELSSIDEGVFGDAYKSTIGNREQRDVKRWWMKKLKHPKAKDVHMLKFEANIKAGIFGIDAVVGSERLLQDAEKRLEAYRKTGIPTIEKDFRVRGDKIMLADRRGAFLDVTGEGWVPESISVGVKKATDIDMDGDTDAQDVLQVAQAAAGQAQEPDQEYISEGMHQVKITKTLLKRLIEKEL
jgi:hypothetical protein